MGRPDPCILFAQSFVHPHLDEYVDEVIFTEPIVITVCEFLEQNASSSSSGITLVGATSPPSFALEVFVQCEGEARFRRLCQPFLYSHSSSNLLEVEAVVTNHLVIRGSYRSLTLVVYGNTAEDLGQFNIEFDLDSSLANLVSSPAEGKLEDLPPALQPTKLSFEESISSLKSLSVPVAEPDLSLETKQLLLLTLKICQMSALQKTVHKVASIIVSAVSSYFPLDLSDTAISWNREKLVRLQNCKKDSQKTILVEARNELFELYKVLQLESRNPSSEMIGESLILEPEVEPDAQELLLDVLSRCFVFNKKSPASGFSLLPQNENMIAGLSMVLLLCYSKESCFQFVNGGGMDHLVRILCDGIQRSTAITLMLLGAIELASRHAIGCEGFLGWWPREDENVPIGRSEGYSHILKLLLQKPRHDVASVATYILNRLRSYEIASKFESAVLTLLGTLAAAGRLTSVCVNSLAIANSQIKKLMKLLDICGPIEDPSPVASARRSLMLGLSDGLLSYKATIGLIASSKYCFAKWEIDTHLLSLLKERGFLPLSAALLSSPLLHSANGSAMDIFVDIAASIEAILLSLLFCRSGLVFLLLQPEVTAAVVLSLQGVDNMDKTQCVPLRYAAVLISKGFFCSPQDVGMITEIHLRVVNAIDRLVSAPPHSEELLWVLWELCALSRSDSGRQALLALGHFPEAVSVLMEALHSVKESEPMALNNASPLSVAIFHSAAEIFEVMVTDSTASSLGSWIGHAMELHRALHSSSPGSNRKDAPTRLLEWVDAGVVYHKKGAIGLLRYAAVLASGGDAHLTSTSILVSDSMDVENVVGDSGGDSDIQVAENLLGKLVSDKYFDGVALRDSSVVQLTTTFRILSFISENSAVAAALYEEGAVTLLYVVLINCRYMLERSSNTYDYLVDEGVECNSSSDLLLERSREQSLTDLLIPSLTLLITLLQKLQETGEQLRNTKLLNALLRLHREVSPKLAACAADLSFPYPGSALGLGAVCHLLVSALVCWPVFGWTPDLFQCLLGSVQATSTLPLGPKEACSLLCLLGDLLPEEGLWLWKNGPPALNALRTLGVATLLGLQREEDVDWYLQAPHLQKLLGQLAPILHNIAQIILQFAFTALVVIQDMLRLLIIRVACHKSDNAVVLLQPIISWVHDHVFSLLETDVFKVHRLLDFLASLLEHQCAKVLLLKIGLVGLLTKALERISETSNSDEKLIAERRTPAKGGFDMISWCLPVFKSFALICDSEIPPRPTGACDKFSVEGLTVEDCFLIGQQLLQLCQVLPIGKELEACLSAFKALASYSQGRSAFVSILLQPQSSVPDDHETEKGKESNADGILLSACDWKKCPPLLNCLKNLLQSIDAEDDFSIDAIEAVNTLCLGALCLCAGAKNSQGISLLKCLFGLPYDSEIEGDYTDEKLKDVHELIALLELKSRDTKYSSSSNMKTTFNEVKESVKSLLSLLQKPTSLIDAEDMTSTEGSPSSFIEIPVPSKIFPPYTLMSTLNPASTMDDMNIEKNVSYSFLGGLADKFLWECPDSSPDRSSVPALPLKRKMSSVESSSRRQRGDSMGVETMGPNAFSRGMSPAAPASGPTRRDTFRQRKPNTSRPPSMHVDDYVARERIIDGASSSSNIVSSIPRVGPTSGRPPSIHVDEFMARQKERQNPVALTGGEAPPVRNLPLESVNDSDKFNRYQQLKADLDDDLQEIDIVFDEESESDDILPFPQPDENLQPAPVIVGEISSPGSLNGESDSAVNETSRFTQLGKSPKTTIDGNLDSEFSSKKLVSLPETSTVGEASIHLENHHGTNGEKAFPQEQFDDKRQALPFMPSQGFGAPALLPTQMYDKSFVPSSGQYQGAFYQRDNQNQQQPSSVPLATGSQAFYDQKLPPSQPPLPPLPPPPSVSSVLTSQMMDPLPSHSSPYIHSVRDVHPPLPMGYPFQTFEISGASTLPALPIRDDRSLVHNSAALLLPPPGSSLLPESLNPPFITQLHSEHQSTASISSAASLTIPNPILDSKNMWAGVFSSSRLHEDSTNSSSGSVRPPPPLPPTPPPFSTAPVMQVPAKVSSSQASLYSQATLGTQPPLPAPLNDTRLGTFSATTNSQNTGLQSYSMPPFVLPSLSSRPASLTGSLFSSMSMQQQGQNQPSHLQPRPPPQPPQPPQPPRPPHPPQHPRPSIQVSQQQPEQGVPLQQSPIHVQVQPVQIQHQVHVPQIHVYYQTQQQELQLQPPQPVEHIPPQNLHQQGDNIPQQQQDSGFSLQQFFASPEAIQALLSDREKLCQLLEQHPKLMQMLEERLAQL